MLPHQRMGFARRFWDLKCSLDEEDATRRHKGCKVSLLAMPGFSAHDFLRASFYFLQQPPKTLALASRSRKHHRKHLPVSGLGVSGSPCTSEKAIKSPGKRGNPKCTKPPNTYIDPQQVGTTITQYFGKEPKGHDSTDFWAVQVKSFMLST